MMRYFLSCVLCAALVAGPERSEAQQAAEAPPNIIVILADDLGYGDVRCFNPEGKIATPYLDSVARDGIRFTDAHSSSSVCSPTRYGLLTGRYNWRSRLQISVLGGMSPRLIEPGRMTVASLLAERGYHTACFGKWHLGMDWTLHDPQLGFDDTIEPGANGWRADFEQPISNGPTSVGFAEFFGLGGSLDMVPYTFIANDRVFALPTVDKSFPLMLDAEQRGMSRHGPAAADFEAEDVLPELTRRVIAYVGERAEPSRQGTPFFLYWPLASPHTPIAPMAEWQGRSGINHYADFVMQTDDAVGQLLKALDEHDLAENTLIILTSDNGCSPQADFPALRSAGHEPSYVFRGHKADIYEGGHRVPYLVRWPNRVPAGRTCDALISLNDVLATCAEIVGTALPASAGEDSLSILPLLLDPAASARRSTIVHHSINGSFAIREGDWKLCLCPDSGGWSEPRPGQAGANAPAVQLFNLADDPGEQHNRAAEAPERVKQLTELLEKQVAEGRSTPGPRQSNTVAVKIRK